MDKKNAPRRHQMTYAGRAAIAPPMGAIIYYRL